MHRSIVRAAVLAGLSAVVAGLLAAPAQAAGEPVTFPSSPKGLKAPVAQPKELDPAASYQPQVACSPIALPGAEKLRSLLLKTYGEGRAGRIAGPCTEGVSEHADGRAVDWMVDVGDASERKAAANFLAWLTKDAGRNARRLGVMYVIYNKKIWGVYRYRDGWRKSSGHTDHVHVSLSWNGARGATSFWTGKVQPVDHGPCRVFAGQYAPLRSSANPTSCRTPASLPRSTSHAVRAYGSRAGEVKDAQGWLGVKRTGVVDMATRAAAATYQSEHDLPRTGVLDEVTWASLHRSSVDRSAISGMTTQSAREYGRDHYGDVTLRRGSAGKAVLVLQRALGMPARSWSGWFGPSTEAALKSAQKTLGRSASGTCTGADWKALAG
ncbi:MAG: peptidoglycan-binding domain-containing protein [Aeromicrobium erythreum]